MPNPGGDEPGAVVVIAVDAAETASSLSSLSLSGSGATTEETNRRDGGGHGNRASRPKSPANFFLLGYSQYVHTWKNWVVIWQDHTSKISPR